jgi:hypothetical protein
MRLSEALQRPCTQAELEENKRRSQQILREYEQTMKNLEREMALKGMPMPDFHAAHLQQHSVGLPGVVTSLQTSNLADFVARLARQ